MMPPSKKPPQLKAIDSLTWKDYALIELRILRDTTISVFGTESGPHWVIAHLDRIIDHVEKIDERPPRDAETAKQEQKGDSTA